MGREKKKEEKEQGFFPNTSDGWQDKIHKAGTHNVCAAGGKPICRLKVNPFSGGVSPHEEGGGGQDISHVKCRGTNNGSGGQGKTAANS